MSKGSKRRPQQCSNEQWQKNWARAFPDATYEFGPDGITSRAKANLIVDEPQANMEITGITSTPAKKGKK